ncbi:putative serine/threonine-protein kinase kinX [Balamuthia mandrillaris]
MEVEEEDAEEEDEDEDEDEEKQKQEQEQELRNDEQVQEDEEKRLEDERKEIEDIRNMVANSKRDMQRRNLKVETFLQQYFQPDPQDKIPASSCALAAFAPTWLHILPAELLDDITTLLGGWRALYHDRALAKLLGAISRFIVYGYYGTASWCAWTANPCFSSSTSTSSCWQLFAETVERISCGPDQEGRSGLIHEENLLFVTFVEVGWKSEWDLFLVGVSPLSGRLVGLHTCAESG